MCSARQSGIKTSGSLETWKVPGMWLTRSQVKCPRPAGCQKARGRRALLKLHGVSSPSLGLRCPVSQRAVPAYPSETRKSQAGTKARLDGSQGGREENLLQDTSLGRQPLQTIFTQSPRPIPQVLSITPPSQAQYMRSCNLFLPCLPRPQGYVTSNFSLSQEGVPKPSRTPGQNTRI